MRCTCMQPLCLDCVVSNTVVASHFKLKKSSVFKFCCLTYFNFTKKCAAFYLTINK